MAATQKKSTAAKKKSTSRSGSSRTRKAAPPPKKPVRREVWGVTFLVLALCVFVSYFGIEAIFINAFAKLLKGLFGYGYYLTGPAFLLSGLILIFHHGRPVQLRVTCTLLLPVLLGALCHMAVSYTHLRPRSHPPQQCELDAGDAEKGPDRRAVPALPAGVEPLCGLPDGQCRV